MKQDSRCGFTLVEVAVIVAIITILAAILIPVFGGIRDVAHRAPCAANLHQLSLAFSRYFNDYDDMFPACQLNAIGSPEDLDQVWFRQIDPYLKDSQVLHCPADNVRDARRTLAGVLPYVREKPGLPAVSYGANWDLMTAAAEHKAGGRVSALLFPGRTLVVADCSVPWACGPVYTDRSGVRWSHIAYANGPPVSAPTTLFNGGRSGRGQERHGNGSFIAYLDGHASFLPAARFYSGLHFRETDPPGEGEAVLVQRPILSAAAVPPETVGIPP
jgi:prepilin-type processing-associated H-X9-DG protein